MHTDTWASGMCISLPTGIQPLDTGLCTGAELAAVTPLFKSQLSRHVYQWAANPPIATLRKSHQMSESPLQPPGGQWQCSLSYLGFDLTVWWCPSLPAAPVSCYIGLVAEALGDCSPTSMTVRRDLHNGCWQIPGPLWWDGEMILMYTFSANSVFFLKHLGG